MKIMQIGNIVPPRKGFGNPQEGRVYSPIGLMCNLRDDSRYWVILTE